MFFFSFYQREDIKQENDESGHLLHRRRFVTAVLPWRCWWVVCTAVKTRQTHLKISPSQQEFCVYTLHYSRLTVCCHPGLTWVTCRSGGSCTPTGSRCSWSSRACSPSWWSLMPSCSPWFFCLWGKRENSPSANVCFWYGWTSGERRTLILRGKLVAREPGAADGFLPQHLPAVAVEGSDHLQ